MGVRRRAEQAGLSHRARRSGNVWAVKAKRGAQRGLLLAVAMTLASGPAGAFDVQGLRPAPGPSPFIGVEGARTMHPFGIATALWVHEAWKPFVVSDGFSGKETQVVSHLIAYDPMVTVGLPGGIDFTLYLPLAHAVGDGFQGRGGDAFRFGDLRLLPRWQFVGRSPDAHFGVSFGVAVTLPTGDPEVFLGAEGVVFHPKLAFEWNPGRGRLAVNLGTQIRTEPDRFEDLRRYHTVTLGLAGAVNFSRKFIELLGELNTAFNWAGTDEPDLGAPVEAILGGRLVSDWGGAVTLGAGMGLLDEPGAPSVRAVLGLAWVQSPPPPGGPPDDDGDGLLDEDDQCPYAAEDYDGFQDDDGCPDPDNDGDGILDRDDICPLQPETVNYFEDLDGCPDDGPVAVRDSDGDHVEDRTDKCPEVPEDIDGFEDFDGCPDPDNDGDGLPDVEDRCPDAHSGGNPGGCPLRDKVKLGDEFIELKEGVQFERLSAQVSPVSYDLLNQVAGLLRDHPEIERLVVEGHTDRVGDAVANKALSEGRASAVRDWLVTREGIQASRVQAWGFGDTRPIDLGTSDDANARNRRVEFRVERKVNPPATLLQISVVPTPDSIEVHVPSSRPIDPITVGFELASKDTVLIIRLPGTISERYWINGMVDSRLRRGLVHPSVESNEATEVRIWFNGRVQRTSIKAAQVYAEPDGLRIELPIKR